MKLVNITNSNPQLVKEQLAHTDAHLVELYSLGQTTVVFTEAKLHSNLVIVNKKRAIKKDEIDFIVHKLFKVELPHPQVEILTGHNFVEISLEH